MVNFILPILLVVSAAHARPLTPQQKVDDFHWFTTMINSSYGPLDYKIKNNIVDVAGLNSDFEKKIAATTTNSQFYQLMVQYVASYHDGHFNIQVPSTRKAMIPVVTALVDGKVLITSIDRTKLSLEQFPYSVGDEIISVDGQPMQNYLEWAASYISEGRRQSVKQVASWTVTSRNGARLPIPKNPKVKLEIRRGTSDTIETTEQTWILTGEELDMDSSIPIMISAGADLPSMNYDNLTDNTIADFSVDSTFMCSGSTRVAIPADAKIITKDFFVAYYHPTPKGNIGYLRVPHFNPQPEPGKTQLEATMKYLNQYEYAIRELENNTVGLIVDEAHNCGGSVWLVNKMISMFMDKPFTPSQFELLATRESYLDFKKWLDQEVANTIDYVNTASVLKLIKDSWTDGASRLTAKTAIDGENSILPSGIRYSKPVVMLIDEVSGSGGDMFPAMMQGLGRVKLFGQTTSGLGGHIEQYPTGLPNSQMKFSMTKSLFYKPSGEAIEDNGATADEFYNITRDDVMYGYKDYQKAYEAYLMEELSAH